MDKTREVDVYSFVPKRVAVNKTREVDVYTWVAEDVYNFVPRQFDVQKTRQVPVYSYLTGRKRVAPYRESYTYKPPCITVIIGGQAGTYCPPSETRWREVFNYKRTTIKIQVGTRTETYKAKETRYRYACPTGHTLSGDRCLHPTPTPDPTPTTTPAPTTNNGGGTPPTLCASGTYPSAAVEQDDKPTVWYGQISKKWRLVTPENEVRVRLEGHHTVGAEWVQVGDTGCYALSFNPYGVGDPCAPANVLGTLAGALGTSAAVVKWLKGIAEATKVVATLSPLGVYLGVCAVADVAKYIQENYIDSDSDGSGDSTDDDSGSDSGTTTPTPAPTPTATPAPTATPDPTPSPAPHPVCGVVTGSGPLDGWPSYDKRCGPTPRAEAADSSECTAVGTRYGRMMYICVRGWWDRR
ncbi:MAG: hypothetical protein OXG30_15045 [bacterium]|nr:hypothetical protein [bacterium]